MTIPYTLPPTTTVGLVHLRVADLSRSLRFYEGVLGLQAHAEAAHDITLSADGRTALLRLSEHPGALPRPQRSTGLYHYALLHPTRRDLARSLRRLLEVGYPLQGASDHLVSEALYLADPDGNGIELYADRPRSAWPLRNGTLTMATDPLDVEGLLGELADDHAPWTGIAAGTVMGHVHLHVANIDAAKRFYCDLLGFDLVLRYGPSALFVSAGGYHHHLGLNTWAGVGAPPPPADAAGLIRYDIVLPDLASWYVVQARLIDAGVSVQEQDGVVLTQDPSGNGIRLVRAE